jgi:single-strand DNA-binding protein
MLILNVSGNVTGDAIVRTVENATVTAFTIASNNRYKTKSGEIKEEVSYVRCSIWNNPEAAKLLYKGRNINVLGAFTQGSYINSAGDLITTLNVRVSFFQVFGKNQKKETVTESHTAPAQLLTPEELAEVETDLPF